MLRLLLLVLPLTALQSAIYNRLLMLGEMNQQFTLFNAVFLLLTMAVSVLVYSIRLRFTTTVGLLIVLLYSIVQSADLFVFGEFDGFYISSKLLIGSWLIVWNWLLGFGMRRSLTILTLQLSLLLSIHVYSIAQLPFESAKSLLLSAIPPLLVSFWLIFVSHYLNKIEETNTNKKQFLAKLILFLIVIGVLAGAALFWFNADVKVVEQEWAQGNGNGNGVSKGGSKEKESMTKKNRDGGIENKDQTKLTGSLQRDKQLVFVAKLDNFFDNGTPNPLYFTSHYYTLFDESTQTFEPDAKMPCNDLFKPDPSEIPLYKAVTNKSVIEQSGGVLHRRVVTAEVYKVGMAANAFVAPSTAFYCQPVTVPQNTNFKSAYKAQMWVSELNSAYFIYNPTNNPELAVFQEQRFEELRSVKKIEMKSEKDQVYYTQMPTSEEYRVIKRLADSLTLGIDIPIDKILSIRDYFMAKDVYGQPLFKYTDNPGVPGLPSAAKLKYFLFENRKGYCAYFAGATLFMLRSLGIPSRIAVGYLAVDRSNKNPGWYWFYQDQAHAWVQVYFPGYGWLDFDTTIPDQNTREAEQPDGTPPEETPEIFLVTHGRLMSVDTVNKTALFRTNQMIYHDKEYSQKDSVTVTLNLSFARLLMDTGTIALKALKPGMVGTAVSRDISLKDKLPLNGTIEGALAVMQQPVPIDELKLIQKKEQKKGAIQNHVNAKTNWWLLLMQILEICLVLLGILLLLPFFYFAWLKHKAKHENVQALYKLHLYRLHMLGIYPQKESIIQFAQRVETQFKTNFLELSQAYSNGFFDSASKNAKWPKHNAFKEFNRALERKFTVKERLQSYVDLRRFIAFITPSKK